MTRLFFIAILVILFIEGCGWSRFGQVLPPSVLLWSKEGHSLEMTRNDLIACRISKDGDLNKVHQCMLDKGFIFDDNIPDYARICEDDLFKNTPGCKSMPAFSSFIPTRSNSSPRRTVTTY